MKPLSSISPILFPESSGISRIPPRDTAQQQAAYKSEYDFTTLFYDVFYKDGKIVLSGPPLQNFKQLLRQSVLLVDGATVESNNLVLGELDRTQKSFVHHIGREVPEELSILLGDLKFSTRIQPNHCHEFNGSNVLLTKSKNNKPEWIRDWIIFHQVQHAIDAVLIYDNGSTDYTAEWLQDYLDDIKGINVLVVSWPFPFGPQGGVWAGGKNIPWDSDYCEYGILEHAKTKYLSESNLVINADVDELLVCKNNIAILDMLEKNNSFYTVYKGRWVDGVSLFPEDKSYSFKSFVFNDTRNNLTTSKWAARPKFLNVELCQWKTHYIPGYPNVVNEDCQHRHFKAISNGWKFQRNSNSNLTEHHVVDQGLLASFDRVFADGAYISSLDGKNTVQVYAAYLDGSHEYQTLTSSFAIKRWIYKTNTLVFDFKAFGANVAIDFFANNADNRLRVTIIPRDVTSKRILNEVMDVYLPGRGLIDPVSGRYDLGENKLVSPKVFLAQVIAWFKFFFSLTNIHPSSNKVCSFPSDFRYETDGAVNVFYWDKVANFGDSIGPYLVEKITKKPTLNVFGDKEKSAISSVGSILNVFDRPDFKVWGTGIMWPLNKQKAEVLSGYGPQKIFALRGWKTYKEVKEKLGWNPPKILGDPALVLPEFFMPEPSQSMSRGKIALVPHYTHKSLFMKINDNDIYNVDVGDPLEKVINEIASAHVCISTSLHGIIVAHAFEVPWVWLRIEDKILHGTSFKFEDFFTVLDRSSVAIESANSNQLADLNYKAIASKGVVPTSKFNFQSLLDHFPF